MISNEAIKEVSIEINDNTFELSDSSRFHAMDMLRGFAMLLGILLHAFLAYSNFCPSYWTVQDPYRNIVFDFCILIIHSFRMELFFFMSGFFANLLYQKRGIYHFIKNRLLRVFVPFLIAWPLILTLLLFIRVKQTLPDNSFPGIPIFHLWFLYYLLIFYTGSILLIYCIHFIGIKGVRFDFYFSKLLQSRFHIFFLALISLPMLFFMNNAIVDTPLSFSPLLRLVFYYSIFFIFGWLINRQPQLLAIFIKNRWVYLKIAMLSIILLVLSISKVNFYSPNINHQLVTLRFSYALCTWSLVLLLAGFFQHHFNKKNIAIRYLSDSSYWLYIMHLPIVIFLQNQLLDSIIPSPIRFLFTFFIGVIILLLSYHFFVRYTFIGSLLNGPRNRTPKNSV